MRALGTVALCFVMSACAIEESRLEVSNPEALPSPLTIGSGGRTKAFLAIFTGGDANLVIEEAGGVRRTTRGKIDMLGVKKYSTYPLRFDFVAAGVRVRFIQPALSPEIRVMEEKKGSN
jgi:hypothetical protein